MTLSEILSPLILHFLLPFFVSSVLSLSHILCICMFVLFSFLIPLECRFQEGRAFCSLLNPQCLAQNRCSIYRRWVPINFPTISVDSSHNQSFSRLRVTNIQYDGIRYVKVADIFLAVHSDDEYGLDPVT